MGLRDQLRRLKREAAKDAVLIPQRDGSTRAFDVMTVWKETFLTRLDLLRGEARDSEVLSAVRAATSASRADFERKFGPIVLTEYVVESNHDDAWVEEYRLLEDGSIEKTFYEGGSIEAQRLLREARENPKQTFY